MTDLSLIAISSILAIVFNLPVFFWAQKRGHLLWPTGILGAAVIGVSYFIITPFAWIVLLTFFVSASILTKVKSQQKSIVQEKFAKGGERDAGQVLANGLTGFFFLVLYFIEQDFDIIPVPEQNIWILGFMVAIATVNADTWATEIGLLTDKEPRWILNLSKKVARGTSGGVTLQGTTASLVGASLVAIIYFILVGLANSISIELVLGTLGIAICGFLGSLIDSFEGASIQGFYLCPTCDYETEKRKHLKCGGTKTKIIRGLEIVDNDFVNSTSASIAALIIVSVASSGSTEYILPAIMILLIVGITSLLFSWREK
ncbi:MAG: DUF92 domain-containing protein [Promethearchaeota archaeon]